MKITYHNWGKYAGGEFRLEGPDYRRIIEVGPKKEDYEIGFRMIRFWAQVRYNIDEWQKLPSEEKWIPKNVEL